MSEQHERAPMGTVVQDPGDGPLYVPAAGEAQLTVRAVVVGCLIGAAVAAMNLRFGLKTGWSIGGSLIAAILSFAMFSALRAVVPSLRRFTPLETNIAQTAGSAAGSMSSAAGLLSAIPALMLLGKEGKVDLHLGWVELTMWAGAVGWLGVFYAVPLRRQMVVVERLRFPTGTATANTITAMFGEGGDAVRKARWLLALALLGAVQVLLAARYPFLETLPLEAVLPVLAVPAAYGFVVLVSPLMTGAGMIIGFRVAASLVLGAVVSWGVLAPAVESAGWVADPTATMSYGVGARGWILWPGVAIMVAEALTSLALSWRTILATFTGGAAVADLADLDDTQLIPNSWWVGGLLVATLLTVGVTWLLFGIPPWMSVIAVALSSVLAAIAVRSTGETDINPTGGVGKVTQLVFGALAPGSMGVNLLMAGVSSAGASQAADMAQDLKTGWLLGASPRQQLIAQLAGVTVGVFSAVPLFLFLVPRMEGGLGGDAYPAPAAMAWKAMAEVLANGLDALPAHAPEAVLVGLVVGVVLPVLRKLTGWRWLPSGLAFGIAFIVPAFYSLAMFAGAVAFVVWERVSPRSAAALGFSVASGLIAGDGLMGVVLPLLQGAGLW